MQSPGGSGGLSVAGHLLARSRSGARVHVSKPTWPNHTPLLKLSGLKLEEYPYYDYQRHLVDFDRMVGAIEKIPAGDILLLHGCCHNPCGADLSQEQWRVLAEICARRGIVPFVDFAYQGLSEGLDEDAYGARLMAEKVPELVVVASCSKNFGVYRERAPLRRNIDAGDVGEAAAFLLSDAGRGVTGEVLMVDSGFHITGM